MAEQQNNNPKWQLLKMTLKEYRKKVEEDKEWAPGWDAIDACLMEAYGFQIPVHFAADLAHRAVFGGDNYLDGCSIYRSKHGHMHLVTYGMTELYANEQALGDAYSKFGYEMTFKLPYCEKSEYMWALNMLRNLALYTYTTGNRLMPLQYISGKGHMIKENSNSKLTGLLVVTDNELVSAYTVHGRLDFLQLVGITQAELEAIISNPSNAEILVERMIEDYPYLTTDLDRTRDYLP